MPAVRPALCANCSGPMTWIGQELAQTRGRAVCRIAMRCRACKETWYQNYGEALHANPPPKGKPFVFVDGRYTREGELIPQTVRYDPDRAIAAPVKTTPQRAAFGFKCAWYAVPGVDAAKLARRLLGKAAKRVTWQDGVDAAYAGSIFVSPRVGEHILVVSTQFLEHAEDAELARMAIDPRAQYFASDRVIGVNVAVDDKGKRRTVGDEQALMRLAGRWSVDPQQLGAPSGNERGWVADKLTL